MPRYRLPLAALGIAAVVLLGWWWATTVTFADLGESRRWAPQASPWDNQIGLTVGLSEAGRDPATCGVAIVDDGVIWIVPLPGVEILQHQELYLAYDWEFWYRKWLSCDLQLRDRISRRYSVASSIPHISASPTSDELAEL